jgi:hypothetical protein
MSGVTEIIRVSLVRGLFLRHSQKPEGSRDLRDTPNSVIEGLTPLKVAGEGLEQRLRHHGKRR